MRKSFVLLASVALIFSCSPKNVSLEVEQVQENLKPNEKSIEEALSDMYVFWDATFGKAGTKGEESSRPTIESINKCSAITTKASQGEEETLAYVVNFKSGKGYSLLNAKRGQKSVIAITDNGSIDANRLQETIRVYKDEMSDDSCSITKEMFEQAPVRDSPDYIYSFLAEAVLECSAGKEEVITTKSDGYPTTEIIYTLSPMVLTKWGQKYPFNQSMKYWLFANYTDWYRKRSPVGCGIIAAAQFMLVVNHPAFNTLVSGYSWSDFSSLCTYYNYSSFLYDTFDSSASDSQKTKMKKLAKGLSIIADEFNAYCQQTETTVNINDVIAGLKNMDSYYNNAEYDYPTLSMSTLLDMLDDGKPTYFRGEHYDSSTSSYVGHAWVVDGYLTVRETYSESLYREYPCLHFNWGWYGLHDGYYTLNSFLPTDRFSCSVIDNGYINYGFLRNYYYSRKFISY